MRTDVTNGAAFFAAACLLLFGAGCSRKMTYHRLAAKALDVLGTAAKAAK